MKDMLENLERVLVSEEEIIALVDRLGKQLTEDYKGKELVVIGMLKGGIPFMADLIKKIKLPLELDFMQTSSYNGRRSGEVIFKKDIETAIKGKHVLIVDDIVDTGKTLDVIIKTLQSRGPASIEVCACLDKPEGRLVELTPKYIGVTIPNEFVFGYGLDDNQHCRNLPFVGVLKKK